MITIIFIYSVASIISGFALLLFIKFAPFGWEDENGFHTGKETFASKDNAERTMINKYRK